MSIRTFMKSLMVALTLLVINLPVPSIAVEPDEMLDDPVLEARARTISAGLRCVVCQNQSIDDSNAELARDLRVLLRERLSNGDTDEQVVDYIVSRYGDFVLLSPPVKGSTYFLWFGPLLFVAVGSIAMVMVFRQRKVSDDIIDTVAGEAPSLSKKEQRQLEKLLNENSSNENGDRS